MAASNDPEQRDDADAQLSPPSDRRGVELVADDGRRFLVADSALIGRAPSQQAAPEGGDTLMITLDDPDQYVSKNHALVRVDRGVLWVIDRGSTNGTTLRGPLGPSEVTAKSWKQGLPGEYIHVGDRWLQIGATIGPEFGNANAAVFAKPPAVPAQSTFINIDDAFQSLADRTSESPRPTSFDPPPAVPRRSPPPRTTQAADGAGTSGLPAARPAAPRPAPAAAPAPASPSSSASAADDRVAADGPPRPTAPRPALTPTVGASSDDLTVGLRSTGIGSASAEPTRSSRSRTLTIVGAGLLVAGLALLAYLFFGRDDGDDSSAPPAGTVNLTEVTGALVGNATAAPAVPSGLDVLDADPELSTFRAIVEQSQMQIILDAPAPVTIFAPTNDAIAALPDAAQLQSDPIVAAQFVSAHLAVGLDYEPEALDELGMVTIGQTPTDVTASTIGGVSVVADEATANGHLYQLDGVLWDAAGPAPAGRVAPAASGTTTSVG